MSRRLITVSGQKTGPINTFTYAESGLGGTTSTTRTYTPTGGTGTGAQFSVARTTKIGSLWYITSVTLVAAGTGYKVNDSLSIIETVSPNDTITITVTAVS